MSDEAYMVDGLPWFRSEAGDPVGVYTRVFGLRVFRVGDDGELTAVS